MISQGLRGACHVYVALGYSLAAAALPFRALGLIEASNEHYARAEELLEWMDRDDLPQD